jgi:hypothetical protein
LYHSPYPEELTPQTSTSEGAIKETVSDIRPAQVKDDTSKAALAIPESKAKAKEAVKAIPAAVSSAIPNSVEELKAQLADAQATIASYAKDGGLRLRKAANAVGTEDIVPTAQAALRTTSQEGVPVKVVAALCFLSFLIAYFFF